jgi:hypothetical protein
MSEQALTPGERRSSRKSGSDLAVGERREFAPGMSIERVDTDGTMVRLSISASSHAHFYIDRHADDELSFDEDDFEDFDEDELADPELRFVVEGRPVRAPALDPGWHHLHAYWHNGHETHAYIDFAPGRLNVEFRDPGREGSRRSHED